MTPIYKWLALSVAVYISSLVIPGIAVEPIWIALIVGICLAFVAIVVKPIINIIALPINILTLGLFSLFLNGVIYWVLAQIIAGFTISSFKAAFLGALLVSVVAWLLTKLMPD